MIKNVQRPEGSIMENYIIRIYRRDPDDPLKPVGMVEVVETSETRTFTHASELIDIICSAGYAPAPDSINKRQTG
jgi:hypothetical protein